MSLFKCMPAYVIVISHALYMRLVKDVDVWSKPLPYSFITPREDFPMTLKEKKGRI